MIRRAQHWTDAPIEGRRRKRVIRNWTNFRTPHHGFIPAAPLIAEATRKPDDWDGNFDFQRTSQAGALQTFFGDTRDPDNPAMVGMRLADRPAFWVNFRPMGTTPNPETIAEGARYAWRGLWKNTTLRYIDSAHKLTKEIVLREPGHPARFRFSVKLPPHLSLVFRNGGAAVLGPLGNERLTLPAPWGMDAEENAVGVTMWRGLDTPLGLPVIVIEVNEDALAGAVYPVTIDPTVQITGTTDLEDTSLIAANNDNHGGSSTVYTGNGDSYRGLVRIATIGAIPAGTITALKLVAYASTASSSVPLVAHIVTNANAWVEGTSNFTPQVGSACWNQSRYLEQNWAGHPIPGCGEEDVDFDGDPSPPEHFYATTGWHTFSLKPEWATAWRDATRDPNGVRLTQKTAVAGGVYLLSTERAGYELYFEVDYDEAPAGSAIAAMSLPRRIQ